MSQDFRIITPGFFQGISEDGKAVEGPFIVNLLGKAFHFGCEPGRMQGDGVEGVAYGFSQKLTHSGTKEVKYPTRCLPCPFSCIHERQGKDGSLCLTRKCYSDRFSSHPWTA
jgi:hypothetical protein